MLRQTLDRVKAVTPPERILVVTAREHAANVMNECVDLPERNVFAEPEGRDTAAAAGFASYWVRRRFGDDAVMGLFPADHRIQPVESFAEAITAGARAARTVNGLVTFGIEPDHPATGYGYIQCSDTSRSVDGQRVHRVKRFHEKPGEDRACSYLEDETFLWNSGMFVWPASLFVDELEKHMPSLKRELDGLFADWSESGDRDLAAEERYPGLPQTSVDYGILEQSSNAWTLPVDFDWNDLGTWDALRDVFEPDEDDNVSLGDVVSLDTEGSVLVARDGVTVAALGVSDLVVVSTEDAVLVCKLDRSEDVKRLVQELRDRNRDDLL